jgi:hypothetical protein
MECHRVRGMLASLACALSLVLSACAAPTPPAGAEMQAALPAPEPAVVPAAAPAAAPALQAAEPAAKAEWGALFVAGDNSIQAFDNATRRLYSILDGKPGINLRRLTSDPGIAPSADEVAGFKTMDSAMGFITKGNAGNCLVFMTSHGSRKGFYLAQDSGVGGLLPPEGLDWLLDQHCGTRPTVAIVSACFSGIFIDKDMQAPNRIILTAAREDRPSFGCSAGQTYTYFDKCLLDSWTWVYSFRELFDRTRECVSQRETELGAQPSEPQAYFGTWVADLQLP